MDLILWRHAEAEPGIPDMERALTRKGHKQAKRMGQWLASQLPEGCKILVSPALRALETAEGLERKFKIHADLAPEASANAILNAAGWPATKESVLVIGHQPTLGQTVSRLLGMGGLDCSIKKGGLWWLRLREREATTEVSVVAVLSPDLV